MNNRCVGGFHREFHPNPGGGIERRLVRLSVGHSTPKVRTIDRYARRAAGAEDSVGTCRGGGETIDHDRLIRIGVADEHALARTGLVSLLRSKDGMAVVGEVADGVAAFELARDQQPDVMVVDLRLTDIDGFEVTRRISARRPSVAVVVVAPRDAASEAGQAIEAGARAYVFRTTPVEEVVETVRMVANGHVVLPGTATLAFVEPETQGRADTRPVSPRELEVLELLAHGFTNRQIAERLFLSVETVKTHVERLFRRLGAADRTEAVALGFRAGLLE